MSLTRMCGVVLWSNPDDQKAVVWCEDQGNLAYYVEPENDALSGVSLDPGDLIEFELREDPQYRRVTNPVLLVQDHASDLVRHLGIATDEQRSSPANGWTGNVVQFPRSSDRRTRRGMPVPA